MTKPGDFFVGVVDLFSILLPGSMLAYLLAGFISADLHGLTSIAWGSTAGWIAFVLGAYVCGHFLNAVGGVVEEMLDVVGWWEEKSGAGMQARDLAVVKMCGRLKKFKDGKDAIAECDDEDEKKLVKRLIKSSLRVRCPVATADLDRLEAISKFFRSLTLVMLIFFGWLYYLHNSKGFETPGSTLVVFLIVPVFLIGSLALYVYQAVRRKSYTYIYFLVHEMGAEGEASGGT